MKALSASLLAASIALFSIGTASSQTASPDVAFKGTMVCAQLPGQAAVVRVPMDMIMSDTSITLARPILGAREVAVGNEMAKGTVDAAGNFTLISAGTENGNRYEGKYTGTIAGESGTFTGTQSWSFGGTTRTRPCTGAFVKSRV
jgi:hypothetical protein